MKTKLFLLGLLAFATISTYAQEQEDTRRFGVELNGGASFGIAKLDDAKLNAGFGFEGLFHYEFVKNLGVYAGWGWNRFASDNSFAGQDARFEETGYVFGLQYRYPVANSPVAVFVRGGGLYNHIEVENAEGDIIADTGHGFGGQAAVGLDVNLGSGWSLAPGVKFNFLNRSVDYQGTEREVGLRYMSGRVSIMKKF